MFARVQRFKFKARFWKLNGNSMAQSKLGLLQSSEMKQHVPDVL
jgi:hypothetical protein